MRYELPEAVIVCAMVVAVAAVAGKLTLRARMSGSSGHCRVRSAIPTLDQTTCKRAQHEYCFLADSSRDASEL